MNEIGKVETQVLPIFNKQSFMEMKMLLIAEIEDLEIKLQELTEAEVFNRQVFIDTHYTMLTKMKTLHMIQEIDMGL